MSGQRHITFDVVGTLVSFDAYFNKIEKTIGSKLVANGLTAKAFGYTWMTAAELEFTFLSLSERHRPYKQILSALFYRTMFLAGILEPRNIFTDEERESCISGYSDLELRSGVVECFSILRDAGFTIWLLTTADLERVQGYFLKAGVSMPAENFISCDSTGLAKPALDAYKPALAKFAESDEKWFAAAHMWDVSAATKVGFKGAYCGVYEKESCPEIFGDEMAVMADDLMTMARRIVEVAQ